MQLSGSQCKQLSLALIDAFPSTTSLERMLAFELDKNLRAVAGEGSLQDIVFKLIQTANSQGWVEDLVCAARDDNPGNPKLNAIAQEILNPNPEKSPVSLTNSQPQQEAEILPQEHKKLDDDLSSARNVDYTKLRDILKAQQWEKADEETFAVMLKVISREKEGWLDAQCIENFPCTDLRTIDQLWVKYSDGCFGFSVQKRVWQSVGQDCIELHKMVGWTAKVVEIGHFPRKYYYKYELDSGSFKDFVEIVRNVFKGDMSGLEPGRVLKSVFSRIQTCKL